MELKRVSLVLKYPCSGAALQLRNLEAEQPCIGESLQQGNLAAGQPCSGAALEWSSLRVEQTCSGAASRKDFWCSSQSSLPPIFLPYLTFFSISLQFSLYGLKKKKLHTKPLILLMVIWWSTQFKKLHLKKLKNMMFKDSFFQGELKKQV